MDQEYDAWDKLSAMEDEASRQCPRCNIGIMVESYYAATLIKLTCPNCKHYYICDIEYINEE